MKRGSKLVLKAGAVVAAVALATSLSGCGSQQQAGAAAQVGTTRISDQEISDWVGEIFAQQGHSSNSSSPGLTKAAVNLSVYLVLLDQLAEQLKVTATQGQVDAAHASLIQGGATEDQIVQSAMSSGIAPSQLPRFYRANVLVPQIQDILAPGGTQEQQAKALQDALLKIGNAEGVTVSPRYGTWTGTSIKLGGTPQDLVTNVSASTQQ